MAAHFLQNSLVLNALSPRHRSRWSAPRLLLTCAVLVVPVHLVTLLLILASRSHISSYHSQRSTLVALVSPSALDGLFVPSHLCRPSLVAIAT